MNKIKQFLCRHYYTFFPNKLNMLPERKIKAVCKKCGKYELFTVDEYKKMFEKQKDNKDEQ